MVAILWGLLAVFYLSLGFCVGIIYKNAKEEDRLSARVIRPANIKIEKHFHVEEYSVSDKDALEIDFPNSKTR